MTAAQTKTKTRVPPHDLRAEEALVGAVLLSAQAIAAASETCSPDDFYNPNLSNIYDAAVTLWGEGEAIDAVTVSARLAQQGILDHIGGLGRLYELQSATPSTTNAQKYAHIIRSQARKRRVLGAVGEIAEIAYDVSMTAEDTVEQALRHLYDATSDDKRQGARLLAEGLHSLIDRLEVRLDQPEGLMTGLIDLDEILHGFRPGQLIVAAGRPGMGKSVFGAHCALNVAETTKRPVLFVSVEMTREEVEERIVCGAAKVDANRMRTGKFVASDWPKIQTAIGHLAEVPLHIEDDGSATLTSIRTAARRLKAKEGDLALIVVDYLQLLSSESKHENRQNEVAQLSRGLKKMAMQLHVPVLALAQLNRGLEMRKDKRPLLSDLRESGAIENDSDAVLFIYRDEYYNPDSADRGLAELIVAKQRNGPTGIATAAFLGQWGRFANMARV